MKLIISGKNTIKKEDTKINIISNIEKKENLNYDLNLFFKKNEDLLKLKINYEKS